MLLDSSNMANMPSVNFKNGTRLLSNDESEK